MKKYEIKNMNGTVLSACAHISEVLEQLCAGRVQLSVGV